MPAGAALVAALPKGVIMAPPEPAISINLAEKAIKVREPMAFKVLHRLLCDWYYDLPYHRSDLLDITFPDQPTRGFTDHLFEVTEGWNFVDQQSRENIYSASWREGEDHWTRIIGWDFSPDHKPSHPVGAWMDYSDIPEGLLIHAG